jgi:hypothetical protein
MQLPNRKQQCQERRAASDFCLKAMLLAAMLLTAIVVMLALAAPTPANFTGITPRFLVDIGAEALLFLAVLAAGLTSLGHAFLAAGWSLQEIWHLVLVQLLSAGRVPPTHLERPMLELLMLTLAVRSRAVQVVLFFAAEQTCSRAPTKIPFRLFQQAPLLVSP